ncbi:hypothetical protein PENTCL1PPCAC_14624 [Pristionchus entomophagus]|uniref:G protein-coupled receptor n=1 Tax=Pristionchus entomophagus TaxID=358040 RepID=A0AAV5TAV9_9BILA|nr:hypothetical protein PENTCL1PPCAC_14624 [Pristionchus entomophagus]
MTNVIVHIPLWWACGKTSESDGNNVLVPNAQVTESNFDNNCLLYRLHEWITGIFHNTLPSMLLLVATIMLTVEIIIIVIFHIA